MALTRRNDEGHKRWTIRQTLLGGFLLIGLLPACVLALMDFFKAGDAMQSAIQHDLKVQAGTVMTHIDNTLSERFQNATIWSQLEVMQDLQVQDVDKRLSNFLAKLKLGYGGVYRAIRVVDVRGDIVSSSDVAELGKKMLVNRDDQQRIQQGDVPLWLSWPKGGTDAQRLLIDAPVISAFDKHPLGWLELEFDWRQIESVLDAISGNNSMAVLMDSQRHGLAASRFLREKGGSWREQQNWLTSSVDTALTLQNAGALSPTPVMVGIGKSSDRNGLDLSVLVAQQRSLALAPVHRMAMWSYGWLGLVVFLIVIMAGWISGIIARPLSNLTRFAKSYRSGDAFDMPRILEGAREVGELGESFREMIQEIEASRRRLVQTSKLAVVGEMSSVIAHEVRTPLGILRSSAQVLRREPGLSDEGRELMGFIESETERLNRLVSTMLDSARPRALVKRPVDIHALLEKSATLLSAQMQKQGIYIDYAWHAVNPVFACDEEQMTQVMLNLLLNATQILKDGGRIHLRSYDSDQHVMIEIADDGPGISPSERERVFEAFFFRREGGVGLGLAIVQQIIQAHGGDIHVQDSSLGGASFLMTLPREAANPEN